MGAAWVSGVNVYATCAMLGLLGRYGVELAGNLTVLESWWIIGSALAVYLAEFIADKIPWFDSVWDAIHPFVWIPAGAVLAASTYSESGSARTRWSIARRARSRGRDSFTEGGHSSVDQYDTGAIHKLV